MGWGACCARRPLTASSKRCYRGGAKCQRCSLAPTTRGHGQAALDHGSQQMTACGKAVHGHHGMSCHASTPRACRSAPVCGATTAGRRCCAAATPPPAASWCRSGVSRCCCCCWLAAAGLCAAATPAQLSAVRQGNRRQCRAGCLPVALPPPKLPSMRKRASKSPNPTPPPQRDNHTHTHTAPHSLPAIIPARRPELPRL